jgi:hypothetical protein
MMPGILLIISTLVFIGFGLATFADVAESHWGLAVTVFLAVATLGVALAFARP